MAANGLTFSSIHVLIVYGLGAAITTIHGDRKGQRRGQSRRWRRCASNRLVRRLLRREIAPSYQNLYTEGDPAPTDASGVHGFKANRPCAVSAGAEAARHGRFGQS